MQRVIAELQIVKDHQVFNLLDRERHAHGDADCGPPLLISSFFVLVLESAYLPASSGLYVRILMLDWFTATPANPLPPSNQCPLFVKKRVATISLEAENQNCKVIAICNPMNYTTIGLSLVLTTCRTISWLTEFWKNLYFFNQPELRLCALIPPS